MLPERKAFIAAASLQYGSAGQRLRTMLSRQGIVEMPGVYNGLSARQAQEAGFPALYLSGAAVSASMGIPDLGLLSPEDLCTLVRQVVQVVDLPLLVDADTGHGGVLNVMQLVERLERAGAAGIQIEDQSMPKKCGHLNGKQLVSSGEMAAKIAGARQARRELVVVARTDAIAIEGFDAAVRRARSYVAAGADAVFPEALTSRDMFAEFAAEMPGVPLLANMTEFGVSPSLTADELRELGYSIVIWPVSALRVAAAAQRDLYALMAERGSCAGATDRMMTRAQLYDLLGLAEFEALDQQIERTTYTENEILKTGETK